VARRSDGSVVAWGDNFYGQSNVPALPPGLSYTELAAGEHHTAARRNDGSVVAWGENSYGQCNVPAPPPGSTTSGLPGRSHTVACRSDGQVVAWGFNGSGQCNVPAPPAGLTYVEVAAGAWHTVARRSDGQVVAWGFNGSGQCNVPAPPAGVTYVEVAAGGNHTVARRSDGQVVAWGENSYGQCNVPSLPFGTIFRQVGGGNDQSLAMIEALACDDAPAYCTPAAPNSVSATGAAFSAQGCPSHVINNLILTVADLPPGEPGIFFYGPSRFRSRTATASSASVANPARQHDAVGEPVGHGHLSSGPDQAALQRRPQPDPSRLDLELPVLVPGPGRWPVRVQLLQRVQIVFAP